MSIGIALAMAGFVMFSHCKLAHAQTKAVEKDEAGDGIAVNGNRPGEHKTCSAGF